MSDEQRDDDILKDELGWSELLEEINKNIAGMMAGITPSAEQRERLRERTQLLAQKLPVAPVAAELELLEFKIAEEDYAIEIEYVREIHRLTELTVIPCTPDFVLGVINLRGQIISVIDIRRFFNLPARLLTNLNKLIVVRNGIMELGLVADTVARQSGYSFNQLSEVTAGAIPPQFIKGITASGIMVLDINSILSSPAIIVREVVN